MDWTFFWCPCKHTAKLKFLKQQQLYDRSIQTIEGANGLRQDNDFGNIVLVQVIQYKEIVCDGKPKFKFSQIVGFNPQSTTGALKLYSAKTANRFSHLPLG